MFPRLAAAVLLAAAAGAAAGHYGLGARGAATATERVALAALAGEAELYLDLHLAAVSSLADRFREWEVLVPEGIESQLRVVGSRFPALARLLVADGSGQVLASFDVAARVGAERTQRGAPDPIDARRTHIVRTGLPFRVAAVEGGIVPHLGIGVPFFGAGGELRGYVGAQLDLGPLAARLAEAERAAGTAVVLDDGRGGVIHPRDRLPAAGGAERRTSHGWNVRVARPARGGLRPTATGGGLGALAALIGALASRRKR